ncbi:hypothetical protein PU630_07745 [Microbacterium horticulturae]|uniref:Uncharacterized protein n=1 Tax=Microbacterium horticulturae TaxID=3028316 RepID=A0ABY8C1U7_9MICO|nr:hypothetical protein [Microbacterium sp. KACC 23027]WEG10424.1 hypothetical protein PU630_07745 [Microbacterium sp. KACC 23027]
MTEDEMTSAQIVAEALGRPYQPEMDTANTSSEAIAAQVLGRPRRR